jgi:hypothetical protein
VQALPLGDTQASGLLQSSKLIDFVAGRRIGLQQRAITTSAADQAAPGVADATDTANKVIDLFNKLKKN